jgi:hypothetical protein
MVIGGLIWCSCTNNQAASENNAGAKTADASSSGNVLFTATIDGQTVTSTVSDQPLQQLNAAFTVPDRDNNPSLLFHLGDVKNADDAKTTRAFNIRAAKKTATVHLPGDSENPYYGITLDYNDGDMSRYLADDVTLTITEISATRVKGSFSGRMRLSDDTPRGLKKTVMVDVKFEIPMATSKVIPM